MLSIGVSVCPFYQVDSVLLSALGGCLEIRKCSGKVRVALINPTYLDSIS